MRQELLPNHFVYVNLHKKFYKVIGVEPFQYDTGEESTAVFSSVAAAGSSGHKNITLLEPDDIPRHLYHVFPGCRYNMKHYFKIPSGTDRFGIDEDKDIGFIDSEISPFNAPNGHFSFWLVTDNYPSVNAVNSTSIALTPQIRFMGYKYDIEEVSTTDLQKLTNGQLTFKKIIVGGVNS